MSGLENYEQYQRPVRLMMAVSDEIMRLVDDALYGAFEDVTRRDVQGIAEASSIKIIKWVRDNPELW